MSYFITHAEYLERKQYITAEQARELGEDKTEWFAPYANPPTWIPCRGDAKFPRYFSGTAMEIKYRAIKQAQPEPVDPHEELRAEYAKQVAEGTTGFYLWEFGGNNLTWIKCDAAPLFIPVYKYRCTDISCMVAKQGEPAKRMLRTEAKELQRRLGDTVEWYLGVTNMSHWEELDFNSTGTGTYAYAPKALKQVSWRDIPVGVMTNKGELRAAVRGASYTRADVEATCGNLRSKITTQYSFNELTLAPASEQPWMYWGGGACPVPEGVKYDVTLRSGVIGTNVSNWSHNLSEVPKAHQVIAYQITGIAKGYKMEGAV